MIQLQHRPAHLARLNQILDAGRRLGPAFRAEARQIVVEGNEIDRLRGVDKAGRKLRRWRWRVGRYEGKTGETLVPNGRLSLAIRTFFAEWRGNTMVAGFRGEGVEILVYHAAGKSGKGRPVVRGGKVVGFRGVKGRTTGIVRDVFGVSPATRRDLIGRFREMSRDTFAARAGRFFVGVNRRAAAFFGGLFS